ncbi:hypothetical protein RvY_15524 [Ramazzottius varieornatus]|uniref:Uncharacterized protein n=1 Tax=Ramazzottius varieornatus TaxID=947166 RepID=A0A1D1VV85_RAMVA|nr:hypothetical protein RvY_15524 [Ramazzottius varieornatus]
MTLKKSSFTRSLKSEWKLAIYLRFSDHARIGRCLCRWAENGPSRLRNDEEPVKAKKARVKPDSVAALQPLLPQIRFALMTMDQLVDGPIKDGVITKEEAAKLVKGKSVAVSRRSKTKQEVGCLNWRLSEEACEDYGDDDDEAREAMTLEILPDMKNCPETSRRFLDLCRVAYPFQIKYRSQEIAKESQFKNFKQTEKRLPQLLLPLSSTEKKLVHDLAGSVSLLWAPSESEADKGDIKERKKGNTKRQKNKEFSGKWVLEIHAEGNRTEDIKGTLFGRVLKAEGEDQLKKLEKTLEKKNGSSLPVVQTSTPKFMHPGNMIGAIWTSLVASINEARTNTSNDQSPLPPEFLFCFLEFLSLTHCLVRQFLFLRFSFSSPVVGFVRRRRVLLVSMTV